MLTVSEAQAAVLGECRPLEGRPFPLAAASGRRLTESITADVDSPPFDKSMMDGYAVRAEDVIATETTLKVLGELTAGGRFDGKVSPGAAVRIMTGAPLPAGADTVVRFEDTTIAGEEVRISLPTIDRGKNVIRRGLMMQRGETVLEAGRLIRAQEIALLAELGRSTVPVFRAPRAAVLATGDELVPVGAPLGPGQICNSNEPMLLAQLRNWGCDVQGLGIARDREAELQQTIESGLEADVLLLTGGVSMGTRDLVPQVLAELGARQVFHKVQLKPGKPVWFGVRDAAPGGRRTLIFGLPGNPVSSMVCSELFVRGAVAHLAGESQPWPRLVTAHLACPHDHQEDRPTWFPARLQMGDAGLVVTPTAWKGSADLRSTADANALIAFPPGQVNYNLGAAVEVWPFLDWADLPPDGSSV